MWGSLADWIMAITGIVAVVGAFKAIGPSLEQLRIEKARDDKDSEREARDSERLRQEQASKVAAWFVGKSIPKNGNNDANDAEGNTRKLFGIQFFNGSNRPVFDVVAVHALYAPINDARISILPPGAYIKWLKRDVSYVPKLPYKEMEKEDRVATAPWAFAVDADSDASSYDMLETNRSEEFGYYVRYIEFTDALGSRWRSVPGQPLQSIAPLEDAMWVDPSGH